MLRLVLGRSGSGKTVCVRDMAARAVEEGRENTVFLVPEQYSFQTERALLGLLGASMANRVEVLSFTRLCERVRRAVGGVSGERLQESGRCMLMYSALSQISDQLEIYRKSIRQPDFITSLLSTHAELKECGILPEELDRQASKLGDCVLSHKLSELSLILRTFDTLIGASFIDPLDDLTRLANQLDQMHFFAGRRVFLDGFSGFTAQEYSVLRRIMTQAEDVTIPLCLDGVLLNADPLFSPVEDTMRRLCRMAKECGTAIAPPILLTEQKRSRSVPLRALEERVFRTEKSDDPIRVTDDSVTLVQANDPAQEAEEVAREIRRLMREEGYRCRDIVVIARRKEQFDGVLDAALRAQEIPFFLDQRMDVDHMPLTSAVSAAIHAAAGDCDSEAIFTFLKTGFAKMSREDGTALDETDIARLENYVWMWDIRRNQWGEEWCRHPRGFVEKLTQEDAELLNRLNCDRKLIYELISGFSDQIRDADAAGIARAIYDFLLRVHAPETLLALRDQLAENGHSSEAAEQAPVWDLLMTILEQIVLTMKGVHLPLTQFAEMLRLVLSCSDLGHIPQGLDDVELGAADRVRLEGVKIVFVMGANEGVFPGSLSEQGLLTALERAKLQQMGLELSGSLQQQAAYEQMIAYKALTLPSQRLYVSFCRQDSQGSALTESSIVKELRRIFPQLTVRAAQTDRIDFVEAARPAFALSALRFRERSAEAVSLREVFARRADYAEQMKALERISVREPAAFVHAQNAQLLFPRKLYLSPSQIEQYHLCRFRYFCRYGLKAYKAEKAELNVLEHGTVIHELLEQIFRQYDAQTLDTMTQEQLEALIFELLEQYLSRKMGGREDKSARFTYLFERIAHTASVLVRRMTKEFLQSDFEPDCFEAVISEHGAFAPLRVSLSDGREIAVRGVIDRVDVMKKDGRCYVRVIDYKTGKKDFQLSDVLYGLNLQMLMYLTAIGKNGQERYGDTIVPAGVLYMPCRIAPVSAERGESEDAIGEKKRKHLRMNGLLFCYDEQEDAASFPQSCDAPELVQSMEHGASGLFIPAKLRKDGTVAATSAIASLSQAGAIASRIERLLIRMADELHAGRIGAVPASGRYDACRYCEYHAVCGHEPDDPVRMIRTCSDADAIQRMKGGEQDG